MIAHRIYKGETAEDIGIPEIQYHSWKQTLGRFLNDWNKTTDFEESFRQWLVDEQIRERKEREADNTEDVTMPSLKSQASGFIGAMKEVVTSDKRLFAATEVYEDRVATCDSCGFLSASGRCGNTDDDRRGCGCFMKNKAKLTAVVCPRGLWKE